jgi:hypothetical protein
MKMIMSTYLLCEVFEGYEHEVVQARPYIRQTPKRRSTAYYLGDQKKERGRWMENEVGKRSRSSVGGGFEIETVHDHETVQYGSIKVQLRKLRQVTIK